jgi:multicomponent K+:H+ antiporter subunit D
LINHSLILPILLPLFAGSLLLLGAGRSLALQRWLSCLATWALLPVTIGLLLQADAGQLLTYDLGNWPAPFGIILLLDRLSALLLLLTAVLAGFAVLYASRGDDSLGVNFHALFQFQLLGINGAFLTGDLFNLFVFFEILLISSYALLVHGQTRPRIQAGLHYVVLNLLGSSLFLIALGLVYGVAGTLNMADLANKVALATPEQTPLLAAAGMLMLLVFGLKAALLPLYFWLPRAYAVAPAAVAALFAIMTKVGFYSILRVFTLVYGSAAGELAGLAQPLLLPLALLTLLAGATGALAARSLGMLLAYLVVLSVGTLTAGLALGSLQGLTASLYYLLHSTLLGGGLFLLADLIARQRGDKHDLLVQGPRIMHARLLGALFFLGAMALAGLPPFSGFVGKLLLLQAVDGWLALAIWPVVLVGGLLSLVALSRAGSLLFWHVGLHIHDRAHSDPWRTLACIGLLLASPLLALTANPLLGFLEATAHQLLDLDPYLALVQGEGQ